MASGSFHWLLLNHRQLLDVERLEWKSGDPGIVLLHFVSRLPKSRLCAIVGFHNSDSGHIQRPHSQMQTQMSKTQIRKPDTQPGKRTTPTTSKKKQPLTQEEKSVLTKVDENIAEIREAHGIGSEIRKFRNESSGYSQPGVMREQAKKYKIPEGVARRYRQFSMTFTAAELNKLYEEFRASKYALKVTHFVVLLDVIDKTVRQKLALDAVHQKLSISRLRKLKTKTINREKAPGGRKHDVDRLESEEEQNEAIQWEASKLRRWLDQFLGQPPKFKPSLKKCLNELQKLLQKVEKLSNG